MHRYGRKEFFSLLIYVATIVCCVLALLLSSQVVHGDEEETSSESTTTSVPQPTNTEEDSEASVGFTILPDLPANQVDESKGYFYLKMAPDEKQTIHFQVQSTIPEERTVTIAVYNAHTNQNGQLDYGGDQVLEDDTLTHSLEEMVTVSTETVTVKNFEEKEVSITIQTPKEAFDGVKVAAICVTAAESTEKQKGLSSSFGYRLGLMITETADMEYNDGQSLNFLKVKPTVHQGKRVIQARFQNPESKVLEDLTIETKLREKGSQEVLRKRTASGMRMAPNSQFDFSTEWGIDPIKPGTYELSVQATSKDNTWEWTEEFTVTDNQAKQINEEATYTLTYPSWVPLVVILLGLVTIIVIGCLFMRRKQWDASN